MNPEPATKLTDRLTADTVHGHAPIHGQSVNPGLTVAWLGERRLLVTTGPLGAPRKGDIKGGGVKTPEGGSNEANRPSHTMFP